jgi:hypothetical protein
MTVRMAGGTTLMVLQERCATTVIRTVDAVSGHQPSSPTSSWKVPVGLLIAAAEVSGGDAGLQPVVRWS